MIREVLVAALLVRLGMAAEEDSVKKAVAEVETEAARVEEALRAAIAGCRELEGKVRNCWRCFDAEERRALVEAFQSDGRAAEEALAGVRIRRDDFRKLTEQTMSATESRRELLKNLRRAKEEAIRGIRSQYRPPFEGMRAMNRAIGSSAAKRGK